MKSSRKPIELIQYAIVCACVLFCGAAGAAQPSLQPVLPPASTSAIKFDVTPLVPDTAQPARGENASGDFAWKASWSEQPEWGGRIGYVDRSGTLRIRLRRPDNSPWVVVAHDVASFQLMDWRLAVLKRNGALFFARGALNTPLKQSSAMWRPTSSATPA